MVAAGLRVGVSVDALAGRRTAGGVALLLGLSIVASLAHEAGHVLALASFGRRSEAMGVNVALALFHLDSDVTDLWTLPRRARLTVAIAGPLVSLSMAGAYALLAADASSAWQWVLSRAAVMSVLAGFANLLPLRGLDGRLLIDAWRGVPPYVGASKPHRWTKVMPLIVASVACAVVLQMLGYG